MRNWFLNKVDELIGVAQYCNLPLLQAHLILVKQSVQDQHGSQDHRTENLKQILPLLAMQAKSDGQDDLFRHLERARLCIDPDPQSFTDDNIVDLTFETAAQQKSVQSR